MSFLYHFRTPGRTFLARMLGDIEWSNGGDVGCGSCHRILPANAPLFTIRTLPLILSQAGTSYVHSICTIKRALGPVPRRPKLSRLYNPLVRPADYVAV